MKRIIPTLLLGAVLLANPFTVHAEEINEEACFEIADSKPTFGKMREESWGKGHLETKNPLFDTPSAYATTETNSGVAYCLTVQVSCIDDNSCSSASQKISDYNTNYIQSATIKSPTKKCEFFGYHTIQLTSNSGIQTCETYVKI